MKSNIYAKEHFAMHTQSYFLDFFFYVKVLFVLESIHHYSQSQPQMTASSSDKCALQTSTDTKLGGLG